MFSQSVLDKIRASATEYAFAKNTVIRIKIPLSDQILRLIGYECCERELLQTKRLTEIITEVKENIRYEKANARSNSGLYNSNRHIALQGLYIALQKKRKKLISAL